MSPNDPKTVLDPMESVQALPSQVRCFHSFLSSLFDLGISPGVHRYANGSYGRRSRYVPLNFCHLLVQHTHYLVDVQVNSAPVRLLPYSLVPGMTFNSPLFLKAVSVIAKQQNSSSAVPTGSVNTPIASTSKGKKKIKSGMFYSFLSCSYEC